MESSAATKNKSSKQDLGAYPTKAVASQAVARSSGPPEPTAREAKLKKEVMSHSGKGKFSSWRKALVPTKSDSGPSDHDSNEIRDSRGARQTKDSSNLPAPASKHDPIIQSRAQIHEPSSIDEETSGPGDDHWEIDAKYLEDPAIRKLQSKLTSERALTVFLQEKLAKFQRNKKALDEATEEKIQKLEEKIETLYEERKEARNLNEDLVKRLWPSETADQPEDEGTSRQPRASDSEFAAALQILRVRKEADNFEREKFALQNKFEHEKNVLYHELDATRDDLKFKTLECDDLHRNLGAAEEEAKKLLAGIKQARKEKLETPNELQRVRKELNRVVQEGATAVAVVDSYYFDDAYFQRQFSALRSDIKGWAGRAFSTTPPKSKRKPSPDDVTEFSRVSRDWESYMESDVHRPAFVQAFVWNFLFSRVFGGRFWELPASTQYSQFIEDRNPRDKSPENHKLFHDFRSAGARYAVPYGTENQVKQRVTLENIEEQLRDLLEPLGIWSVMGETQSCTFALQIIRDAIVLDFQMLQQKALFVLFGAKEFWNLNKGEYDPAHMEIRYGKEDSPKSQFLVLVVAPMLLKRGNAQGQSYDTTVVIEKAQVDTEVPKGKKNILGRFT